MKVYSSTKGRQLSPSIRQNVNQLASLLKCTSAQSLSLSPSGSVLGEEEAINLAREFVSNLEDPFQCMIIYPLVLDCRVEYAVSPLIQATSLPAEIHPIISLFLIRGTQQPSYERHSRKIIDIFYFFLASEDPQLYEQWLQSSEGKSLGEWFYSQCLFAFFQNAYSKEQYTLFFIRYLRHGLAYLFLSAIYLLRKEYYPPSSTQPELLRLRKKYLQKHSIN